MDEHYVATDSTDAGPHLTLGADPMRAVIACTAVVMLLAACGTGTPTAATTSASTTAAPSAPITTTASGAAPHSQLLPDLVLPVGSTSPESTSPGDASNGAESWRVPASWGANSKLVDDLRSQLPLSKPYDGLAWCQETGTASPGGIEWSWDDGQHYINVAVDDHDVNIGRDVDDPTWGGCASAAHSALANVDMPTGSQLESTSKPGTEIWDLLITRPKAVAWLQQRLPVGRDYRGLQWCEDASDSGSTEWQWGDTGDFFEVHIVGETVSFTRGPNPSGCFTH
jgi:hypothetical protein